VAPETGPIRPPAHPPTRSLARSVIHPLEVVGMETLRCTSELGSSSPSSATVTGRSSSGWLSGGMRVALDMIGSSKKKTGKKKVVVVSTFEGLSPRDVEDFKRIVDGLQSGAPVLVKFVHYDARPTTAGGGEVEEHWLWRAVAPYRESANIKVVRTPSQLRTCFQIKETKEAHVIYSGTLQLADKLEVMVKIVPKIKKEPFMALGNTSNNAFDDSNEYVPSSTYGTYGTSPSFGASPSSGTPSNSAASGDWYRQDDIEQKHPVPVGARIKAYKFGNVLLPMSGPVAELAKLSPDRGIRLVGFMDRAELSPELFMGASKVLFGDKASSASVAALCSLAAAMVKKQQVALLRVVLRAGSSVKLTVAFPVAENPAYFILKEVPFMQDVASINCAPLPEPEAETVLRAREFVQANMLDAAVPDLDATGNPTLHRAVNYFTRRFLMSDGGGVGGEYDGEDDEGVIPAEGELFVECFGEAIVDVDS